MTTIILFMLLLQVKHFIFDGLMSPPNDWTKYWNAGGIKHAVLNALGTTLCFAVFGVSATMLPVVLIIDFVCHYNIDFLKKRMARSIHESQWGILHNLDQMFHQMTYLLIIAIVVL